MWAALIPLISSLLGEKGPLGQFFKTKADTIAAENQYKLEVLKANVEFAKSDAQQVQDRLNSTSQDFKQTTFWFICVPVVITLLPFTSDFAVTMWGNFKLIPEWFQILFVSVYSSIWGLPIAKEYLGGMFKSLGGAVEARRDYKLEKLRINRQAFYDSLRESPAFKGKGIDKNTVDMLENALNASEN